MKVKGQIVRVEQNGFGVVELENGKPAFFDSSVSLTKNLSVPLKTGTPIISDLTDAQQNLEVIRLDKLELG